MNQGVAPPVPVAARVATAAVFFLNGAIVASWVPHIPAVKARHAIGDGALGLVLLAMAVGSLAMLPAAGSLVDRFGSRAVTIAAALGLSLAVPLPVLSPAVPVLVAALALLGAANSLLDVAMNAQAAAVESAYGRPIMSSFHALFSLGGLAGALLAGGAMSVGLGDAPHVLLVALGGVAAVGLLAHRLLPTPLGQGGAGPALVLPSRGLLGLGALALMAFLTEGAMGDWSAVYLHDTLGSSPAEAAAGFAAFSGAMAVGRLGGDRLVGCFGPGVVLRTMSTVATVGLGLALVVEEPWAAVVGFGAVGLGIANAIPILFGAATRVRGTQPGAALAAVATVGYLGYLAGPPLIGLVAEGLGLTLGLGLLCVLCALMALRARASTGLPADAAASSTPSRP